MHSMNNLYKRSISTKYLRSEFYLLMFGLTVMLLATNVILVCPGSASLPLETLL
jgi:hypothetical protein